jgi:dTDP-4-amino-4,6-dideoxygalactose transaminase
MADRYYISDLEYGEEEETAVLRVLKSRWLTMGPLTEEFENAFSRILNGCGCALVSNGTAALHLALHVLGVGPGDEVILPSLTFAATANVVVQCGGKCVFADIESLSIPLISPGDVKTRIGPRTRVIMPVHYAGFPASMKELERIAEKERQRRKREGETRPLYIVEDAAHAAGAQDLNGRALGAIGDIGCFSFFSNKNIATGEGGLIATGNKKILERIKLIRSHGLTHQTWERHNKAKDDSPYIYDMMEPGYNYRPTEITAALGLAQLGKLNRINNKRRRLFERFHEKAKDLEFLILPFSGKDPWGKPSYHILPILLKDGPTRIKAGNILDQAGIQTSHHYRPVHTMSYYRKVNPKGGAGLGKTEEYALRELTLPLHPKLRIKDMDYILKTLQKAIQ